VHTIDEIDSLYITFSGFGSWIELPVPQSIIYEWIANGEKEPILRITTNVINGNENVSSIEYKDIYRETLKIETNTSNFQVNIFPNPVNEELLVENMNRFSLNYTILDLKGKVHCEGSISEELNQIDIENIPSGQYIIQFFNVGNRAVYPFVKN
jgi:formylmethanofuran dehydrogenase subunit E-like metal-binding protein